jgi:hypothetical protein
MARSLSPSSRMVRLASGLLPLAALLQPVTSAAAKQIDRQQIGQEVSDDRTTRTRTECIDRDRGRAADAKRWEVCTEWRTQANIPFHRTFLVLDGPNDLSEDDRKLARSCMNEATAAAQIATKGRLSLRAPASARSAFAGCAAAAKLSRPGRFRFSVKQETDWTDWR